MPAARYFGMGSLLVLPFSSGDSSLVERAVGQLEKEPVADCAVVMHHFDIDELSTLAEVGE
jgi:hypothetical protein